MGRVDSSRIVPQVSAPILYVEDDANDRLLLELACNQAGVRLNLKVARDGEEAIAYLMGIGPFSNRTNYPPPALILLDLKLPRKSGFEVLEWIRERNDWKDVPIIILSSSNQDQDVKRAFEHGAIYYFVKPLSLPPLVQMVKEIQAKWLT